MLNGKVMIIIDSSKFTSEILDAKIKKLADESDISGLLSNSDLDNKIKTLSANIELKAQQNKSVKLQTQDLCFFLGKNIFGDNGF